MKTSIAETIKLKLNNSGPSHSGEMAYAGLTWSQRAGVGDKLSALSQRGHPLLILVPNNDPGHLLSQVLWQISLCHTICQLKPVSKLFIVLLQNILLSSLFPSPPPPPFLYRVSNPYYQLAERALPRHADSLHFQAAKLPSPERHDGERLSTQGGPGVHNSKSRKLEIRANTSTEVNLACLADS